jgi:hypothetical protein
MRAKQVIVFISCFSVVALLNILAVAGDDSPFSDVAPPAAVATPSAEPEIRTWTDNTGKFQTRASLVGCEDDKVRLKLPDATVKAVPLNRLSDADREYVRRSKEKGRNLRTTLVAPPKPEADAPWADVPSPALPGPSAADGPPQRSAEKGSPWVDVSSASPKTPVGRRRRRTKVPPLHRLPLRPRNRPRQQ